MVELRVLVSANLIWSIMVYLPNKSLSANAGFLELLIQEIDVVALLWEGTALFDHNFLEI